MLKVQLRTRYQRETTNFHRVFIFILSLISARFETSTFSHSMQLLFTLKTSHVAENGSTANPTRRSATAKLTKMKSMNNEIFPLFELKYFTNEKICNAPQLMRTENGGDN